MEIRFLYPHDINDPIRDALRRDCVAYWKMDEVNGNRSDKTGRNNTLIDVNSNVGGAAGKIVNGAQFTGDATKLLRRVSHADVSINPSSPFYLWTWTKLNKSQISGNGIVIFQKGSDDLGEQEYSLYYYDPSSKFVLSNYNGNEASPSLVVNDNTWYFLEAIYNPALGSYGQIGLAINGDVFTMADLYEGGIATFNHPLHVGNDDNVNFVGAGLIDESGIINNRLPTVTERTYLYNNGNGVSLFP